MAWICSFLQSQCVKMFIAQLQLNRMLKFNKWTECSKVHTNEQIGQKFIQMNRMFKSSSKWTKRSKATKSSWNCNSKNRLMTVKNKSLGWTKSISDITQPLPISFGWFPSFHLNHITKMTSISIDSYLQKICFPLRQQQHKITIYFNLLSEICFSYLKIEHHRENSCAISKKCIIELSRGKESWVVLFSSN